MVFVRGSARIRHARSGEEYTIFAAQLEFHELESEERAMGSEVTYLAVIDHPDLGELTWTLSEYPVGAENYSETDIGEHDLLQNVEFGLGMPSLASQRDQTIQSLIHWFHERYEDPVHEMPYNGREGGFHYIGGGPFDARETLFEAFPEMPEDIVEAAANEIEADGTLDWAARRNREDFDDEESLLEATSDSDDRIGEDQGDADTEKLSELIEALPDPITYPSFDINDHGGVSISAPGDLAASPLDDPLFVELKSSAEELVAELEGTNRHTDLLAETSAYADSVSGDNYSIQKLYARGVRFSNVVAETEVLIADDELPPLRAGQAAKMKSILELHAAYIMSSPEGRRLSEGATAYQQSPEALTATKQAAKEIKEAVHLAAHIFDEETRSTLSMMVDDIGDGAQPSRSTQVAVNTLGALAVRLLKWTASKGLDTLFKGIVAGSAIGITLVSAGTASVDAVVTFLVAQAHSFHVLTGAISPELGWARSFSHIFQRLASVKLPSK